MAGEEAHTGQGAGPNDLTTAELVQHLSQFEGQPQDFLVNLLAVQCRISAAAGGAILRLSGEGRLDLLAAYPPVPEDTPAPAWLAQAAESAGTALARGGTLIQPAHSPEDLYGQPAARHLIMIPLAGPQQTMRGLAAFMVEADDEIILAAIQEKLELTASLLSLYEMRLTLQRRTADMRRLRSSLGILAALNGQERFHGLGMAFCNELASQWECERVGLGFLKGRYVKLTALSHTEKFSRKMEIVQSIEAAMEECLDQDVEIIYPSPDTTTFVNRCAGELSRRHGPTSVLSLPMRQAGECDAVVILERPGDRAFGLEDAETLRLTADLCSPRLMELQKRDRWFGARMAGATRKTLGVVIGPKHTWAKLIVLAVLGFAAFLTFAKGNHSAEGTFVLEAIDRQVLPAPYDGRLKEILAEPNQRVRAGEDILATLDTTDLRLQLSASRAEKAGYDKEEDAARRDGKIAQAQIAAAMARKLQAEIDLLESRIAQAVIRSPVDGVVVSEDIKRRIGEGGPVSTGDVLFEVAPLNVLWADLFIPEDQIADVAEKQTGELAAAADPSKHVSFTVERINPVAEVIDRKNVFKVRILLEHTEPWMRPGMEGIGKIHLGRAPYGKLWTRRLVNWVRMRLWI